jgi:predicted acylesterase/phospholipase RssA
MKGVYYIGVMRYLYIENIYKNIKYIAGTSIGAFFAVAIALRIPVEYLEERFLEISNIKR